VKYKGNIVHTCRTPFDHLLGKKYMSIEYGDLWMGITLSDGVRTTCSKEVIERIRNQSGHREGHKNVLWNQEGRKMFHRAGRRVDLREVYLVRSRVSQADVKSRQSNSPGSWQSEGPKTGWWVGRVRSVDISQISEST
jgi:hypothetical protein